MTFVVWKEQFSVNNKYLDVQHQKFCEFLNQMHEAIMRRDKEEVLQQTFLNLTEYAEHHFSAEEELLLKHNYPDIAAQQQQHEFFVSYLYKLKDAFEKKEFAIPESTLAFMKDWLLEHILLQDKKYAEFINSRT